MADTLNKLEQDSLAVASETGYRKNTSFRIGNLFYRILQFFKNLFGGTYLLGDKENVAAIKAISNPTKGDTWRALDTDHYWTFDGKEWNDLGVVLPSDAVTINQLSKVDNNSFKKTHLSWLTSKDVNIDTLDSFTSVGTSPSPRWINNETNYDYDISISGFYLKPITPTVIVDVVNIVTKEYMPAVVTLEGLEVGKSQYAALDTLLFLKKEERIAVNAQEVFYKQPFSNIGGFMYFPDTGLLQNTIARTAIVPYLSMADFSKKVNNSLAPFSTENWFIIDRDVTLEISSIPDSNEYSVMVGQFIGLCSYKSKYFVHTPETITMPKTWGMLYVNLDLKTNSWGNLYVGAIGDVGADIKAKYPQIELKENVLIVPLLALYNGVPIFNKLRKGLTLTDYQLQQMQSNVERLLDLDLSSKIYTDLLTSDSINRDTISSFGSVGSSSSPRWINNEVNYNLDVSLSGFCLKPVTSTVVVDILNIVTKEYKPAAITLKNLEVGKVQTIFLDKLYQIGKDERIAVNAQEVFYKQPFSNAGGFHFEPATNSLTGTAVRVAIIPFYSIDDKIKSMDSILLNQNKDIELLKGKVSTSVLYTEVFGKSSDMSQWDGTADATIGDDCFTISKVDAPIRLLRDYSISKRTCRLMFVAKLNSKFTIGTEAIESTLSPFYSCVVDAGTNTISIGNNSKPFSIVPERTYFIDLIKDDNNVSFKITDFLSGDSEIVSVVNGNSQKDIYCIKLLSGTSPEFKAMTVFAGIDNPYIIFYGDSITEGAGTTIVGGYYENRYGTLIGEKLNKPYLVSGRGSGNINGLLGKENGRIYFGKIYTEVQLLRPKYVMIMVGTNGGNTGANLKKLINDIISFGCIPILNNVPCRARGADNAPVHEEFSVKNELITQIRKELGINGCLMNVATSLNNDGVSTDISMYEKIVDYNGPGDSLWIHPKDDGHLAMFHRSFVDVPEIYADAGVL